MSHYGWREGGDLEEDVVRVHGTVGLDVEAERRRSSELREENWIVFVCGMSASIAVDLVEGKP